MGFVNKIFTSVSGIYNSVNPLTLSGVNDVIVVRGAKRSSNTDHIYKCSPFQLRFSRLQFLNSKSQIVNIYINGKLTDITMTITPQGDLYFEEELRNDESVLDYDTIVDALEQDDTIINGLLVDSLDLSTYKADLVKYKLNIEEEIFIRLERYKNLKARMFGKKYSLISNNESYYDLSKIHNKFIYLLESTEHYEFLISKYSELSILFENLISGNFDAKKESKINAKEDSIKSSETKMNNSVSNITKLKEKRKASIKFSRAMNIKFEKSVDSVFNDYLTTEIDDIENLVVRIEDSNQKFYFNYFTFTKIFFEVKNSKSRKKHLLQLLKSFHNVSLGWNIFGTKRSLKRDVSFSLILNSEELSSLDLEYGKNEIMFKISGCDRKLEGLIYLWDENDKVLVSDIDGTITKSDVLGHLCGFIGKDWSHTGVASLYTRIVKNGYKIIYLSSRPLGQSENTKNYLKNIYQNDTRLPQGPVILNPDGVFGAIYREVIARNPEEFKIRCLNKIKDLFDGKKVFVAGFGNRVTDVVTYKAIEIPNNRIYTVNSQGLLQAEYSQNLVGTYHTINEFVDSIFPPINASLTNEMHAFSDFNWWK